MILRSERRGLARSSRWPPTVAHGFVRHPAAVACVVAASASVGVAGGQGADAAAPAAATATATGRVTMTWTYATANSVSVVRETGRLEYEVDGPVMGEQGRRASVPLSFPAGYPESKSETPLYLRARLVHATLTSTFHAPCADGGAADLTKTIASIIDARSILTHDGTLQLDVLRHRGTVSVMPYARVQRIGAGIVTNSDVVRGLGVVRTETTGTRCTETRETLPPTLDAAMLLPRWVPIMWSSRNFPHLLTAQIHPDGSVVVKGTSTDRNDDHHDRTTMRADVALTFHGPLRGLGAQCTWPSDSDLASTTTPEQALAIVHRAGMNTLYAGTRPNMDVGARHFWIRSSSRQWWCGIPYRPGILYRSP